VVEARFATQPMLPLRLFRIRGVAVGNGMLLLFGAIAIAMWYFTSLFLQNALGYSALEAGLGQTPAAVTFVVTARIAAGLLPRTGVRPLVLAGCGCFLAGFGWLAQAHADSGYVTSVLGPTLLIAIGIGLTFPTLTAAATADAPAGDAGIIGGLANTRQPDRRIGGPGGARDRRQHQSRNGGRRQLPRGRPRRRLRPGLPHRGHARPGHRGGQLAAAATPARLTASDAAHSLPAPLSAVRLTWRRPVPVSAFPLRDDLGVECVMRCREGPAGSAHEVQGLDRRGP
jgi:hypothetical protein